jgi:prepilin-type N-terminal cleavage/methylation domain-containing protein
MRHDNPARCGDAQKGFTLVESLVVMIVGVVLLAGAAAGIGRLFHASQITEEASNITQLRTQLVNLISYAGYKDINNDLAIKFKAIPTNMTVKDNKILNTWGGEVVLGVWEENVFIDYHKVPEDACQQLTLTLGHSGWAFININDKAVPADASLKEIGERCKAGGDDNKLAFVIKGRK